jgi:hypothetical protein
VRAVRQELARRGYGLTEVRILDLLILSARAVFEPLLIPAATETLRWRSRRSQPQSCWLFRTDTQAGSGWPVAGEPPRVIMQVLGHVETGVPMEYLADIKQRPDLRRRP